MSTWLHPLSSYEEHRVVGHLSREAVRKIREKLGLTQRQLGALLFKTQASMCRYETDQTGGSTIQPYVAYRLIQVACSRGLHITFNHIYGGEPLPDFSSTVSNRNSYRDPGVVCSHGSLTPLRVNPPTEELGDHVVAAEAAEEKHRVA